MIKSFLKNTVDAAKRYAPSALSPEKRFAKALINVSALMTMADGEADEGEVETTSQLIFAHTSIQQYLSSSEAHGMYSHGIETLQEAAKKGDMGLRLQVNAMVGEIADTVRESRWRAEILETAKMIGESNDQGRIGSDEQKMLDKIKNALA